MKLSNANAVRAAIVEVLFNHLKDHCNEDCAMIASNSFNFPVVASDGEEGFVEVVVKVVKDDSDDCYQKRADYIMKQKEKAAKAAEKEKASAEKKAKAEAKKAKKEEVE